jgi:phage tail tape-measure protein
MAFGRGVHVGGMAVGTAVGAVVAVAGTAVGAVVGGTCVGRGAVVGGSVVTTDVAAPQAESAMARATIRASNENVRRLFIILLLFI